jgi:hypothetical protein
MWGGGVALPHQETPIEDRADDVVGRAYPPCIRHGNTPVANILDQPDPKFVARNVAVSKDNLSLED